MWRSAREGWVSTDAKRINGWGALYPFIRCLSVDTQARLTRRLTTEACQQYLHVAQCP